MRNNKNKIKTCPLLDKPCLKNDCEFYHQDFDRCFIDLLAYNLYGLTAQLKKYNSPDDK